MSGLFLASSILIGLIARPGEEQFVDAFVNGARDLLGVALIIGLGARHRRHHGRGQDHRHNPQLGRARSPGSARSLSST